MALALNYLLEPGFYVRFWLKRLCACRVAGQNPPIPKLLARNAAHDLAYTNLKYVMIFF